MQILYTLIRSKRRSIQISINNSGELLVRAPLRAKEADIQSFVQSKAKWVKAKQQQVAAFDQTYQPVVLQTGQELLYLGRPRALLFEQILSVQVLENSVILPRNYQLEDLKNWLKAEAKKILTQKTEFYARQMGVSYTAIRLSGAKTRWGSCSAKNSLNFSWRLIMCPPDVVDYLVVHELAHVIHKNHSPRYWSEVEAVLPNYKQQQKWLKANRKIMDLI